jgi:putrescine importer
MPGSIQASAASPAGAAPNVISSPGNAALKRNLGLWAIVGLGLGYMTPTVVFDTFGIVSKESDNVVPLAYLTALVVMMFTAVSYGKMSGAMPSAGSAFTYARRSIHPNVGFLVGWTSLLDYILLPMVNAQIIRTYLEAMWPGVPSWIWVVLYCFVATSIIYTTMRGTSNFNMILLVFAVIVMAVFTTLVIVQLVSGGETMNRIGSIAPFWHGNVQLTAVLTAATVVCFSFIGFDAVTMYVEEAKSPMIIRRAILLTVMIGGAIFLIPAYFSQLYFPKWQLISTDPSVLSDSTLPVMGHIVGGHAMKAVFTAAGFAATLASGLASHASVSRMLLVMGRNNVLPKKLFGYINPRTHTPTFNIVLVGAVCLLAIAFTLEQIASFINFGALIAFTFVNLSVIAWFAIRKGRRKTGRDIFSFIVLPAIGVILTGTLWSNLHIVALWGGLVWLTVGILYLAFITHGFRRKVAGFDEKEEVADLAE